MKDFDPNSAAMDDSGIFGLPHTQKESALVLLPVPWEATTSYGGGTSKGPAAIFEASKQVDLFDSDVLRPYEAGIFMKEASPKIKKMNQDAKRLAQRIIRAGGVHEKSPVTLKTALRHVNKMSERLNQWVYQETRDLLMEGKLVGLVGGDHSIPLGALKAISERYEAFGVLHFDAHSDTRDAFEGFPYSHASIMRNVLNEVSAVIQLTQVGIRDFCEEEFDFIQSNRERIHSFFDADLAKRKFEGESWHEIVMDILSTLPNHVWISFDIDGLDPRFCPHTGTPVPGGLCFNEAVYLISSLVHSGKKIIGFDLNEVAPSLRAGDADEWDANVGARLLFKLCAFTFASHKIASLRI